MRIIEPSAHIIEKEFAELGVYQRIDRCAAVCYQRPPKPTEEEAQEFCRKMVKVGHGATLEMAQIHLVIGEDEDLPESRYMSVSGLGYSTRRQILSGSIRSFLESPYEYGSFIWNFLAREYPLFFTESDPADDNRIRFAIQEEIPWQHKYVAVRFIVNRAVSHELVRHRPCSFLQESQRYCRYGDDVVFIRPEWYEGGDETHRLVWEGTMDLLESTYQSMLQNGLKPQQARAVLPNSTKTELIVYASLPEWQHIFKLRCSPAADPEMRRVMIPLREEFKSEYQEVE